jgi:NhaA family Na+:H+ antiporter
VVAALVLGKPAGILLFSLTAVRLGVASLPNGVGARDIAGVGLLAGIGFTVSIFIAALAFDDAALIAEAKIGVLSASVVAGIAGYTALRLLTAGRGTVESASTLE